MKYLYNLKLNMNGEEKDVKVNLKDKTVSFKNPERVVYIFEDEEMDVIARAFKATLKEELQKKFK